MNGCPPREWESDQNRVEATQVEANFLAKTIIGDFYLKLSTTQYTLQIALLITSGGTPLHTGQPMLEGVPILSKRQLVPTQYISEALGQWDKNSYNKSFLIEKRDGCNASTRIHAYTFIGRSVLSVQLSQQWVFTSGVHNTTSPLIFKIDFLRGKKRAAGAYPREQI
jgi:hypothetical protein